MRTEPPESQFTILLCLGVWCSAASEHRPFGQSEASPTLYKYLRLYRSSYELYTCNLYENGQQSRFQTSDDAHAPILGSMNTARWLFAYL